nr:MAG TPA: hypothetical protein [Caudoviricetes sp.]
MSIRFNRKCCVRNTWIFALFYNYIIRENRWLTKKKQYII